MEEENWKKIETRLPSKFKWDYVQARRAKGGIIMAINKNIKDIKFRRIGYQAMETEFQYSGNKWRVITVYCQNVKEVIEGIKAEMKEEEEENLIFGGDFNARMGNKGGPVREEDDKQLMSRKSVDKITVVGIL